MRYLKKTFNAFVILSIQMASYFNQGFKGGLGIRYSKQFIFDMMRQLKLFSKEMQTQQFRLLSPTAPEVEKLRITTQRLHPLLPRDERFSYSILIPVYRPPTAFLKVALESALHQTAPSMEVLVGFDGPQPDEVYRLVDELKRLYPHVLKSFQLNRETEGGSIAATTNYLANKATGNFLLLVDHDDWIRPDLLYRYEQTLRLFASPENRILYCNEYKINERDCPLPKSEVRKIDQPCFPYLFNNFVCHCLLVPKALWQKIGGLRVVCSPAQDYDLVLRLDLAGATFHNVPCYLYAWRMHSQSTAKDINQKPFANETSIRALSDYSKSKNLDWQWEPGYLPCTYRAIPQLKKTPSIHVIILFKDQKELTLKAVDSILQQQGVHTKITAVNNQSSDTSIAEELQERGVEVLSIHEPFNYSRLNNLAVKNSRVGDSCDTLLFLNNDVELQPDALLEMARWIDQPQIGMVGCRLHYPNGLLQHGGIVLFDEGPTNEMTWNHIEKQFSFEEMIATKLLGVRDAVTAACAMIKRQTFLDVGGFNEIWYPVAYSDTNLAVKLKHKGLWCFYTPYAVGTHHESVSRGQDNIEDYEMSSWLHRQFVQQRLS